MIVHSPLICAAAALVLAASLSGCGTRKVRSPEAPGEALVVLLPDADTGRAGRVVVSNGGGKVELSEPRQATVVSARSGPAAPVALSQSDIRGIFGAALDALPAPQQTFTLFFEFDSEELIPASAALTPRILAAVQERRLPEVLIVGHTDTTGTRASNFDLGLRRANRVRTILRDAGLEPEVIDVISHGETEPLVATRDATFEPRNRRVEITVR